MFIKTVLRESCLNSILTVDWSIKEAYHLHTSILHWTFTWLMASDRISEFKQKYIVFINAFCTDGLSLPKKIIFRYSNNIIIKIPKYVYIFITEWRFRNNIYLKEFSRSFSNWRNMTILVMLCTTFFLIYGQWAD